MEEVVDEAEGPGVVEAESESEALDHGEAEGQEEAVEEGEAEGIAEAAGVAPKPLKGKLELTEEERQELFEKYLLELPEYRELEEWRKANGLKKKTAKNIGKWGYRKVTNADILRLIEAKLKVLTRVRGDIRMQLIAVHKLDTTQPKFEPGYKLYQRKVKEKPPEVLKEGPLGEEDLVVVDLDEIMPKKKRGNDWEF